MDRDSFVTSYKWLNPDIVDALDMHNGLVSPSFGPSSPRKLQFWVRVLFTVEC